MMAEESRDLSSPSTDTTENPLAALQHPMWAGPVSGWTNDFASRIQQFQKMQSLGRLALGVAHEFNNLLIVISGSTELLRDQMPSQGEPVQELEEIRQAVNRATAIVQQLLQFGRHPANQVAVVDLGRVVRAMGNALRCLTRSGLSLQIRTGELFCPVRVPSGDIEQVLTNLVINACDATPREGRIVVETGRVVLDEELAHLHGRIPAGNYATLSVSDTGCGMDATTLSQVFQPFFTTKDPGKGTGLGLSIVWEIVARNHGYITVMSAPGVGTTFTIYLPLAHE